MSARRRVWTHLGMAAVTAMFVAAAWKARPRAVPLPPEMIAARKPVSDEYADDARCASCHSDVAALYAQSGMARAFNTWKDAEPIEDRREGPGPVVAAGDLNYQVVIDGGRMFQREFRIVDGVEIELNRREAVYTLGSGMKGRGYLARVNGYLTAMPLSWYTARNAWDLSPGYRENNQRFDRPVVHECMACHNGPFGVLPGTVNGYVEPLPSGLGCQRCHGPGAAHVRYQERGGDGADPMPRISKLDPRRQLDVCLQCHLLSDDNVRHDCGSFRPGDRLENCRVSYFAADKGSQFDAVGHGPRTMASKCYAASGGKLTCTVCHDPHRPAGGVPRATYNRRCDECHERVPCKRPLKGGETPRQGDCVACHMPTRKAEDIPHATSTDHWIQVPGRPLGAPVSPPKDAAAKVVAFTPGSAPLDDAVAETRQAARSRSDDDRRRAVSKLETLLTQKPVPHAAAWVELARAQADLGRGDDAVRTARRAVETAPASAAAWETYAVARGPSSDYAAKAETFEAALRALPWCDALDVALLESLSKSRAELRAFELYDRFLQFHPPRVEALMLLGEMKRRVKAPSAEAAAFFEKAAAADGVRFEPHLALAWLATADGAFASAARHARNAALRNPGDASLWALEASAHARAGDRDAAKKAAEQALARDPANAEASRVLRQSEPSTQRKP